MQLKAPITVQVEMTNNCNYLCKHCYNYWRYETTGKKTFNEIDKSNEILDEIIKSEVFHVVITGGEPLMKFENVKKYIEKLKDNNVMVSMNSNLGLMTDKKAKELKNLELQHILTSIYSHDPNINNFQMTNKKALEKTIAGIENSINNGIRIGVNTVVDKTNFRDIYTLGQVLKNLGVESFNATRFVPATTEQLKKTLNRKEMIEFLDQMLELNNEGLQVGTLNPIPHCFENGKYLPISKGRGCSAGLTSAGIGVNGDLRACQHTDIVYGNILEEGLQTVWNKVPTWKENNLPKQCEPCSEKSSCGGGCRQYAVIQNGSLDSLDPLFTKPLLNEQNKIISNYQGEYMFFDNLKVRSEKQGGIIFKDTTNYVVLDDFGYNLVKHLYSHKFSTDDLVEKYDMPKQYLDSLFKYLDTKGIVKKI